ncbi:MAG: hypothetical protein S4CHLAM37_07880 [Chlamydiia bacterium]|nr:hypothetical protein [Chlamydiia bacterium]
MSSENIVHPSEIESQLTTIWDSLQGKGKTRASLFNLIIYSNLNTRTDYLYEISQKLIEKFPSRIIFITVDDKAPSETLKTSVSVISSESENSETACDFINILLSKDSEERAPFLILPHLLTDLPIYLLWADDPSKNDPTGQKLEKLATRVIFDSESTDHLGDFASALLKHKDNSGSDIADLNWARIEGWRTLLAETFNSKEKLSDLSTLSQMKIFYNCTENNFFCHTKIQALYLQTWIATQMNWEFTKSKKHEENTHFYYKNAGKEVELILVPTNKKNVAPGRLISIEITTEKKDTFQIKRKEDQPHVIDVEYSTPNFCQLPFQFIFDRYESGQTLVKEIFHKGTSNHYLKMLNTLSKFEDRDLL